MSKNKYNNDNERLKACYLRRIEEIKKGNKTFRLNKIIIELERKIKQSKLLNP